MKTFRHPLVLVIMDVFVVTTAADVFSTFVVSLVRDLENSKTFFGARSNGFKTTLEPVVGQISTISLPNGSGLSPASSEPEESLPVVRLESEQDSRLVEAVLEPVSSVVVPSSVETNAARTSGGSETHASIIEAERVAVGFKIASSLFYNLNMTNRVI